MQRIWIARGTTPCPRSISTPPRSERVTSTSESRAGFRAHSPCSSWICSAWDIITRRLELISLGTMVVKGIILRVIMMTERRLTMSRITDSTTRLALLYATDRLETWWAEGSMRRRITPSTLPVTYRITIPPSAPSTPLASLNNHPFNFESPLPL